MTYDEKHKHAINIKAVYMMIIKEHPSEHPAWQMGRALAIWCNMSDDDEKEAAAQDAAQIGFRGI